jgi:hypothetical protein
MALCSTDVSSESGPSSLKSRSSLSLMSTHASILVDSVRPPSAEVYRTAASFP